MSQLGYKTRSAVRKVSLVLFCTVTVKHNEQNKDIFKQQGTIINLFCNYIQRKVFSCAAFLICTLNLNYFES